MLVFTRKREEAIVIGDGIEVRILRVGQDSVKIGVTAPPSVAVHRQEIYDLIRAENEGAVRRPGDLHTMMERLRRQPKNIAI